MRRRKTRDESAAVAAACARACDLKDGYGCMAAGFLYGKGKSVPRDFARANELLKAGCDLADGVSCYLLAYNRSQGNGAPQDLPQAAELYSRACGFGVPSACQLLGEMQEQGRGAEQDMKAALASYRKACELGGSGACELYVDKAEKEWLSGADSLCSEAVSTGNLGDANIFCVNSCERGQGGSCYLLAVLFSYLPEMLSGNKPADPAKARELYELSEHFYKKAADLGVEDALFFLTDLRCFKLDDAAACLRLGDWMAGGQDGQGSAGASAPAEDLSPLPPEFRNKGARMAADIYERACSLGESRGCELARKLRELTEEPADGG